MPSATINNIKIENFRGITTADIPLFPVTVVIAPNNAGKSTLLESCAIALTGLGGADEILKRRGWSGLATLHTLLPTGMAAITASIGIEVRVTKVSQVSVLSTEQHEQPWVRSKSGAQAIEVIGNPRSGTMLVAPDGDTFRLWATGAESPKATKSIVDQHVSLADIAALVGRASRGGDAKHRALVAQLQALDENLLDIRAIPGVSGWEYYAIYASSTVPLAVFGDGTKRLIQLAGHLSAAETMPVLIEEPECFQHPGVLSRICEMIWAAADTGTQVIVSTHSVELFERLRKASLDSDSRRSKFGLIEISRTSDGVVSCSQSPQGTGPFLSQLLKERLDQ